MAVVMGPLTQSRLNKKVLELEGGIHLSLALSRTLKVLLEPPMLLETISRLNLILQSRTAKIYRPPTRIIAHMKVATPTPSGTTF